MKMTSLQQMRIGVSSYDHEDNIRVGRLLRIIIVATLALNPLYTAGLLFLRPFPLLSILLNISIFVIEIASFWQMRQGNVRTASLILTVAWWLYFTFVNLTSGGSQSPAIVGYFLLILVAGLLLGGKAAISYSILCIFSGVIILVVELRGQLPTLPFPVGPEYTWLSFIIALIIMAVLLSLATSSLTEALTVARYNAIALAENNARLESVQAILKENIEELKSTEQELRFSEERLRMVVSSAPILIWGVNQEGIITVAQGETLKAFSFDSHQFIGTSIFDYEDTILNISRYVKEVLQGKQISVVQTVLERTLEMQYVPLLGEDQQVVGVTGIVIDITERVRTEEALRQSQKLESLGVLAGGIAHDFNNLLVAMMSQNALALKKLGGREATSANHIGKALRAAERAAQLTRQMLAYAGRSQLETRLVQIDGLVAENVGLLRASIAKNVVLQAELAQDLPPVLGDSGQLQQVVMNLIINAADAIGIVPGMVMVHSAETVVDMGEVGTWRRVNPEFAGGHCVMVEVRDTGSGMSAVTLAKIFDPFFTTKTDGRGLGLAAVSGIVRSHRGDLWVQSELGKGTVFRLLLPVWDGDEMSGGVVYGRDDASHGRPKSRGKLVLVIDDEEPVLEAVTDILALSGVETLTAVSGPAGIALFKSRIDDIAVILLDLSMPDMNGEETFYALRRIDPTVPIVLSSGYDEGEAKKRIADAGQADFLAKPYDVDILSAKVSEYVVA